MSQQTIGQGSDSLLLKISQDAYQGNAQYTVSVDGRQIGGTLTADSSHSSGQSDAITVKGSFGTGTHAVTVNFVNDAYGGSAETDRNLYVDGVTFNGNTVANALMSNGSTDFSFGDHATTQQPAPPPASSPSSQTIGSGADSLILKISQDAYQGDAQYTVKVDGKQIGSTLTAGASHSAGQDDAITVKGDFGTGSHTVIVEFLNDAYGGSQDTDRNLYVDAISLNGKSVANGSASLMSAGPADFKFGDAISQPTLPQSPSTGGGSSTGGDGLPSHHVVYHESFDGGNGNFTNQWGHVERGDGEVSVISKAGEWGDSGLMMNYGQSTGYGLYEFTVKTNKDAPGTYSLLWPGDDSWPGSEIDLMEINFNGGVYSTVHWRGDDGSNQYKTFDLPNIDPTQYHTYAVNWQPGAFTFYVDGKEYAHTTEHVPSDAAHGGIDLTPGVGAQTSWNVSAQGGTDAKLTLTDFTYSAVG